ncbi:DUF2231 domain-containing protein [Goodfellowiella coeruleoviolacea]|uniref:DUF2231 domain-containing protein n=1 Tax=Goodfellowiella coeruleoviolacea TaxID=334858 RepID=A0AAE3GAX5_9PSEU|nr:DUF2231 domain-containing protein [Goodfellowiella coeruleoviolacea]MCP2164896.1 hypothetical protein [Goodfellowiella coeruleoviolacea]
MLTVFDLPAHPLVVHAVVVLLPLASLCAIGVAVNARWRRKFGWPVLVLTALAVAATPMAGFTGAQLRERLGAEDNPGITAHANLAVTLLPIALGFGVVVVVLLVAGRLADRERTAEQTGTAGSGASGQTSEPAPVVVPRTWRRIAAAASVLVVVAAVASTTLVVMVGHSGSTAVWSGVAG